MKIIAFVFAVALVGTMAYQIGWNRGVSYESVAGAIAHGQIDLQAARAIRSKNDSEALRWVELDLKSKLISLLGFGGRVPAPFKSAYDQAISAIQRYQEQYAAVRPSINSH